jgi:hypothetical protein
MGRDGFRGPMEMGLKRYRREKHVVAWREYYQPQAHG